MADNTETSLKKHVDYAQSQVDEQAILDKYNAATLAQYNAQREQNRQAENQFYNQMYNTQKTAMDTIRQSNAAAVSTGASRGMQAANELSAILGLQSENVASATELAQANRQTAQEETAAVLENVLNAYQATQQERSQLVSQGIEAASIEQQQQAADQQTARLDADALQKASETGFANYMTEVAGQNKNYKDAYSLEGSNSLNLALSSLTAKGEGQANDGIYFADNDFKDSGTNDSAIAKFDTLKQNLNTISNTYGLDLNNDPEYDKLIKALNAVVHQKSSWSDTTAGQILNIFTWGISGFIEAAATNNWEPESFGLVSQVLGDVAHSNKDTSKATLTKYARDSYALITNYIKNKYNAKQNTKAQ